MSAQGAGPANLLDRGQQFECTVRIFRLLLNRPRILAPTLLQQARGRQWRSLAFHLDPSFKGGVAMATAVAKSEPRKVRPWFRRGPLESIREEMEELFSRTFGEGADLWTVDRITPSLDLSETDSALEVRMDIPGMEAKDIDIQVNANVLTVSGERKEEREEKGKTYHRVERRVGSFSRSVTLPCPVKEDAVDAQYKNGILFIKLPKTEEAKARKITVKG
jgi:HSP20 family protein